MNAMPRRATAIATAITAAALAAWAADAAAQSAPEPARDNVFKVAATYYDPHSKTSGVDGIGVPAGADADVKGAWTALLTYERMLLPVLGVELAVGIPPKVKADAKGSVAFLGDDVVTARSNSPTLFLNYHFGEPGAQLRPYLGAGVNHTWFTKEKSTIADDVKLGTSTGWAAQAGLDVAITPGVGLFASVAYLKVKSKLVASGATVLTTTIDFRPWVYTGGLSVRF